MPNSCPRCGAARSDAAPAGLCPRCLMGNALDSDGTYSFASEEPGRVLETLAHSVGPMPRVLLPDTKGNSVESPVVKPSSEEMPPKADRSSRVQLLGEIARGGMGAILKGRDPDLGRDLAVKVLLEAHRDKPELVRRFVEEAQIGGQLQHPGVVPVYELGTFGDSRPYFTMKLVKGRTLAELLAERPQPGHDRPRFVAILLQVAQMVAYAHSRGVIHRDLKPSNIMVGSFGEVQVMDWGLAKVLPRGGVEDDAQAGLARPKDETVIATNHPAIDAEGDHSRAGSVLGTPSYMSPEQARGETDRVDERADVFALGSILAEVLTGQPAFTGRSSGEILRKAARGDLLDAFSRLDASGADAALVDLARSCLAAEPEDRPGQAQAVADRLLNHINSLHQRLREAELAQAAEYARAEEAKRTAAAETARAEEAQRAAEAAEARARAERQARRLQVGLAAAMLALTTMGGMGVIYDQKQRSARAATVAKVIGEASTLRDVAGANPKDLARWQTALAAVRQAESVAVGDPEALRQLAALSVDVKAGAEAAERDKVLLDKLVDIRSAKADDPDGNATDAAYAEAFREGGLDLAALPPAEAGAKIKARPTTVALALSAALDDWATVRRGLRNDPAGAGRLAEASRVADPDPWRIDLRVTLATADKDRRQEALKALAGTAQFDELGAVSLDLLGNALAQAGELAAAERVLRRAQRRLSGDVWINYDLARVLERLSRRDEAIRFYTAARSLRPETAHQLAHALAAKGQSEEAIDVFQDLTRLRPWNGRHLGCLGSGLKERGRSEEAAVVLDAAVAADREAIRLKPDYAWSHNNLGDALSAQGKLDEAVAECREAIRLQPDFALAHNNLGNALNGQGKLDEAVAEYRAAIRLQPDLAMAHNGLGALLCDRLRDYPAAEGEFRTAIRLEPDYANAHYNLGNALKAQGKTDPAIAEYREAIRLQPDLAKAHYNLGVTLAGQGKVDEAVAEYRTAIRLQPDHAMAHNNLGIALAAQGKLDEAVAAYRTAIRLQPDYARAHVSLGLALAGQGKVDEAIGEYHTAIRLQPDLAAAHTNLGLALAGQGKVSEAVAEYRTAIRLRPELAEAHANLGNALNGQGKLDEAVAAFRTAIRLQPDLAMAHTNLGAALRDQGKVEEAVAEYRTAIRLKPDLAEAHYNLGTALRSQGDYAGSLAMLRRGHELGSRQPGWRHPSARWVAEAERLSALAARLPALLKGEDRLKDVPERLAIGQMCYDTKHYAAAVRFWAEALAADPKLGDDRRAGHRYNAACVAALAGAGQGTDDPKPDDAARAELRAQALDWLKAERAAWAKVLDAGGAQSRPFVQQTLQHWHADSDLAGVRDAGALAKLPESERVAWRSLWAEVDSLLARARGGL